MQKHDHFSLILNSKMFCISSNIPIINDFDSDIRNELINKGQYEVKSCVRVSVFENFLKYLVDKEIPYFWSNNIIEYEHLSKEFNCMQNLIQIFRKKRPNETISKLLLQNETLKKKLKSKSDSFLKSQQTFHQVFEFLYHNRGISTHSIYLNIRNELQEACKSENLKFVDLFCREKVEENGLIYVLNENEKTAGVYSTYMTNETVFIPKSIFHNDTEYVITIIFESAFKESKDVKSIQFSEDSQLQIIDKNSLPFTLESITIPSTVVELREGWCTRTEFLTSIEIIQNNRFFINYEDKLILGKSSPKNDTYDLLLFAARDIETAVIPSFIKRISPYAFEFCWQLKEVKFSENSNLKVIDENAFSNSSLESILIPSHVSKIAKGAFYFCEELKRVQFQGNSELLLIDKNAFVRSSLEGISIPSTVVELKEGWCNRTGHLTNVKIMSGNRHFAYINNQFIIGKSNSESDDYDCLLFARRDIESAIIPSFIKRIAACAFDQCTQLQSVKFADDSKLEIIDKRSFSHSSIEDILIPSHVKSIEKGAFYSCLLLKKVEFFEDSELLSIGEETFMGSLIESLSIPSNLAYLNEGWCWGTPSLTNISIMPNNPNFTYYDEKFIFGKSNPKSQTFDLLLFARRDIQKAVIPSFIKKIAPNAFNDCNCMKLIEFQNGSELQIIDKFAFLGSSIEQITIPQHVTHIMNSAFSDNQVLKYISFEDDCELQIIDEESFYFTQIGSFIIPPHVTQLGKRCFDYCEKLQIVEISENCELPSLSKELFNDVIIMIPKTSKNINIF